jgi:Flp pilus assembly protein TadG
MTQLSWRSAEEGAAAVEASVLMSVLFLLIVGSMECGRAFWIHNTMLFAVEEAGRYAMTYKHAATVTCPAQSQADNCPRQSDTPIANCSAARARQVLSDYQVPNISVSVSEDATTLPATVTVCASYSFDFIAPQVLPYGALNFTSQVIVPLI